MPEKKRIFWLLSMFVVSCTASENILKVKIQIPIACDLKNQLSDNRFLDLAITTDLVVSLAGKKLTAPEIASTMRKVLAEYCVRNNLDGEEEFESQKRLLTQPERRCLLRVLLQNFPELADGQRVGMSFF
jgi:biopolymer transport protein ExbD